VILKNIDVGIVIVSYFYSSWIPAEKYQQIGRQIPVRRGQIHIQNC